MCRTCAPPAETSPWWPCVSCGRTSSPPAPPSLFSSKCPSPFAQKFLQAFPTQVLAFLLPTCWVRLSHHASTSPSSTLSLTRVCPLAFLVSSLRVPRFPRRRCPNFATTGTIATGNDFALMGFIAASRCCWQTCTVSIDEFSHQLMSWRNIDSCENSIAGEAWLSARRALLSRTN